MCRVATTLFGTRWGPAALPDGRQLAATVSSMLVKGGTGSDGGSRSRQIVCGVDGKRWSANSPFLPRAADADWTNPDTFPSPCTGDPRVLVDHIAQFGPRAMLCLFDCSPQCLLGTNKGIPFQKFGCIVGSPVRPPIRLCAVMQAARRATISYVHEWIVRHLHIGALRGMLASQKSSKYFSSLRVASSEVLVELLLNPSAVAWK